MSRLKSRIERIEKQIAVDEKPMATWEEIYHYLMLADPEEFRRETMDPHCRDRMMRENALNTPVSNRVKRMFRRGLFDKMFENSRVSEKMSSDGTDEHSKKQAESPDLPESITQ